MTTAAEQPAPRHGWRSWLTPRRLRTWREYLTAYLMIAPAVLLIFIFGIFPVGFALYVSLHKWRLKRGDIIGLDNYTANIGNLAYLLVFALALALLVWAYFQFRRTHTSLAEKPRRFWLLTLPGVLLAAAFLSFIRWTIVLMPNVLDIADKITGVDKTRALFITLLTEAFNAPEVVAARTLMLILIAAAVLAFALCLWFWRTPETAQAMGMLATAFTAVGVGAVLLRYVYAEMMLDYNEAVAEGIDPGIFPQLISILSGIVLLYIAWQLWRKAKDMPSNFLFLLRLYGAMVLIVGGWILIGELPVIVAAGDPDLWVGLQRTLFYSLGTIPFQLSISLFLAILLFQGLKGSQLFRIIFFLPYVTPTVASAAVFRQLFSNRQQAPMNSLLNVFGLERLQWIWEPKGVLKMIANGIGIENWPSWADGPSLALVVIMIFSIWVFVGYDTIIYLAGLGNIPREMSEAAEVDGAGRWQVFRYITFPMLSPTTYFLTIISVIGTFKAFNHIWVMRLEAALGTTDTISVVIFSEFFEKLRYGYASAMAFVLFAIILLLTYLNTKTQGSKVFYG